MSRSDLYQWKLLEIPYHQTHLDSFDNTQDLAGISNPIINKEQLLELQDQLIKRLWELVEVHCTEVQKITLKMYWLQGMTQQEIALARGKSQMTVTKCLNGQYYKKSKYHYKGAYGLLKEILNDDSICVDIIKQIDEIKQQ